MLTHGAQKCEDNRGYTPLFWASSAGSSANLIDLLDTNSDVNFKAPDGKTPISKANTSSTVKLLTSYGAETTNYVDYEKRSDFSKFIDTHLLTTPTAILNECISEVDEELLVLDFSHFQYTTEEKNEMDLHLQLKESDKDELLLHPVMKTFLNIKWSMYQKTFWIHLFIHVT